MQLNSILQARADGAFEQALKLEIENLPAGILPLQGAAREGGYVDDQEITVSVIAVDEAEKTIQARVGIFFTEIVANCSCGDEPVEKPAYCEMLLQIDKSTGDTVATLQND